MLDPSIHLTLQNHFGRREPDSQSTRCLNVRHKDAGCRLCVDHCPVSAISLSERVPIIPTVDPQACIRCGICMVVCPTDVFSQALPPEATVRRTVRDFPPAQDLTLICPLHPQPQQNQAPPRQVIRHQRCLAALNLPQLLALTVEGQRHIWLDDSFCHACPIGRNHEILLQTLTGGRHLQTAFARPLSLHSHTLDAAELTAPHPVQLVEITRPAYTRRGLFKVLGQVVQQRTSEIVDNLSSLPRTGPVPVSERMPPHVPASRRRLNQQVQALAEQSPPSNIRLPTAEVPYGNVALAADQCSGCQLCARFCPTAALRFDSAASTEQPDAPFTLDFTAALCLDCNICVIICPEDAITLSEEVPAAELATIEPRLLLSGELVACAQCGAPTRRLPDCESSLCYICRRSIGKRNLMSDLLNKLDT